MTILSKDTWVLVADSEKALFLRNETDGKDPFLTVVRKKTQENPPTGEQAANRPGRMSDGPSQHRSAMDDTDWHALAKDRFATDLADMLYTRAHNKDFDRLVLVADPSTLGSLREALHKVVSDKIVGEVPKTLTNHPLHEIENIVKAELAKT